MSRSSPRVKFLLLNDFRTPTGSEEQLDDLRHQLKALPDFEQVELSPSGRSAVVALVPARNQRQCDRLKALVNEKVSGWRVIDEQDYELPATF